MYLDQNAILSDEQAITASAASTNVIDLGAPGYTSYNKTQLKRNLGAGGKVPFMLQVVQSFNTLTSLTIAIQSDDDVGFGSPKVIYSQSVVLADLVKGASIVDFLPMNIKERYIRCFYTVVGTNPTLGKINAGVVTAVDNTYKG